jgi:hydrogenase/urease accessory protein HupE
LTTACVFKTPSTEVRPVLEKFRFVGLVAVWMLSALAMQAHDPGLSAVAMQIKSDGLHADLSMALADVKLVVPSLEAGPGGQAGQPVLDAALPQLQKFAMDAFEVEGNGRRILPEKIRIQSDDSRTIHFLITFPGEMTSHLSVRSAQISRLSRGHRQYLALRGERGELLAERMLDANNSAFEQTWQGVVAPAGGPHSFASFLLLGVVHILTGYDHICFLLGLLIVGGGLRDSLKIITAFTLAHSVTLAFTVLNVIQIPPRIVEPLIAVSIVYVGVENIFRRDNLRRRWLLGFGFGLIHGCGFAAALRELNIGAGGGGIAMPLLSFNLGVELGQLAIAAIALPIIWRLKSQPLFLPRFAPACSIIVSLAGAYWLVQRVWFN